MQTEKKDIKKEDVLIKKILNVKDDAPQIKKGTGQLNLFDKLKDEIRMKRIKL